MNSNNYVDMLGDVLINYIEYKSQNYFIFQQDNASIHVCKHSKEWFSRMDIPFLEWPACSPDCNPMENLWAILTRNVYLSGRQFDTVLKLQSQIKRCWNALDEDILKNLINSMPNRVCITEQ